jgi:hypothetical protein
MTLAIIGYVKEWKKVQKFMLVKLFTFGYAADQTLELIHPFV